MEIAKVQKEKAVWNDLAPWCRDVDSRIFHVGIYTKALGVIEIGPYGLERNAVKERKFHYDIVARFPPRSNGIRHTAVWVSQFNPQGKTMFNYPLWREGISRNRPKRTEDGAIVNRVPYKIPHHKEDAQRVPPELRLKINTGGWIPSEARVDLNKADERCRKENKGNKLARMPVCSHFVAMILYLEQNPNSTIAAVSSKEFDYIFKMTPSHLLHQVFTLQYLCQGAEFVGMQHQGKMICVDNLATLITCGDWLVERLGFKPPGPPPKAPPLPKGGF
jgi:hypothetical protein